MDDTKKKIDTPKTIRLSDETFDEFKSLCKESGVSAQVTMDSLLLAYRTKQSQDDLPEIKTDIDNYISHLNAMQESYLHILQLNKDTEIRVRAEFVQKLESKDKIIVDLQEKLVVLEEQLADAKNMADSNAAKIAELTSEVNRVTEDLEREKHLVEIQKIEIKSQKDKLDGAADILAASKEKSSLISELKQDCENKTKSIENLTAENEKLRVSIEIANKQHQADMETAVKQAELDRSIAIAKTKDEYADKLERLRTDKETLSNEVISLKDKVRDLERQVETLTTKINS